MKKICTLLFSIVLFSIQSLAQFNDFPTGYSKTPKTKLKGSVHTILSIQQRGEHVFDTTVEVYNKEGKLIESISSNANIEIHSGSLIRLGMKTIFIYGKNGNLTKEKVFSPEGKLRGYEDYIYDKENRLVKTILSDSSNKKSAERTYTYFPEKREVITTWNVYRDNKKLPTAKNLLSYNEKNQWTKRTEFEFGDESKEKGFVTFEYNSQGNLIKELKCCEFNFGHRYKYKFDKLGNWIERENTYFQFDENGKEKESPHWMNEYRVITYYSDYEAKP